MTSVTSTTGWVDDYLARIGVTRPVSADLQALRDLQLAHLLTVPLENLSIHLGELIVLDQADLVTKVVRMHRGGFCYELNGAFAGLLTALGFRVSMLSARVFGTGGQPGPPFDHMILRVDLAEPWLADVGFGRLAMQPLRLRITLGAVSVTDDLGYVALSDLSRALGDVAAACRVIGGHMVTVLAARWRLGHELYRETGDVDLGITPIIARDHHVVGRLKDLDYTQVAGNRL